MLDENSARGFSISWEKKCDDSFQIRNGYSGTEKNSQIQMRIPDGDRFSERELDEPYLTERNKVFAARDTETGNYTNIRGMPACQVL